MTLVVMILISYQPSINAGELDIPNSFTAGTAAVAADVNENFTAVETAVDGNAVDIASVLATVAAMEARLATLEANNLTLTTQVTTLETDVALLQTDNTNLVADNTLLQNLITNVIPYLEGGTDGQGQPTVFFSGVNLHVNNGDNNTSTVNGTGNFIIGYDRPSLGVIPEFCTSVGPVWGHAYTTEVECESNGGIWSNVSQKIGSHYLVVGNSHSYTQKGGIVSGSFNVANGLSSNIIGGRYNYAGGSGSTVIGGQSNIASGFFSSVTGGRGNLSSGGQSNVSGGENNTASGTNSYVSGGTNNVASGQFSNVSGGDRNTANGISSSVSGGLRNEASALWGTVGGGADREAAHEADWAAGTLLENF